MPQKTYMYDTQWNQLINAIGTGDSSAVVTALSTIKTSIDNIYTRLNAVGFNTTQWDNLVDAITSGGEGGTIDINTTQWTNLLSEISKGDMSATATALNNIYTRLNTVGFNATQWNNLTNAISSQTITVDLSNINSDNVSNLSNVTGGNITNAFNNLNSTLSNLYTTGTSGTKSGKGLSVRYITYGKFAVISCINPLNANVVANETLVTGLPIPALLSDTYITCEGGVGVYLTHNGDLKSTNARNKDTWVTFTYMYLMK